MTLDTHKLYFKGLKYIGSIHLRFLIPDRLDLITTIKKECLCARNGKTFGSMSNVCSLQTGLKDLLNSERFLSNPQSPTCLVLTDQKRTAQILRVSHVYTIATFVGTHDLNDSK